MNVNKGVNSNKNSNSQYTFFTIIFDIFLLSAISQHFKSSLYRVGVCNDNGSGPQILHT